MLSVYMHYHALLQYYIWYVGEFWRHKMLATELHVAIVKTDSRMK